jgi:ribosomal protein S18 acetylase RimI-like enzyme
MSTVQLEPLRLESQEEAAEVLARAFVTNPLHVAAFGAGAISKNEAFFKIGLSVMRGPKFVAVLDSRIVGVLHWVESPACQFSGFEKLRMTPAMIAGFGLPSALRVGAWLSGWSKHDLAEPHSHFGPIAVDPAAQGRRIGHRLMEHFCAQLDASPRPAWLETDRPENVTFYRRFGFETTRQASVLGVPNYFMRRPSHPASIRRELEICPA